MASGKRQDKKNRRPSQQRGRALDESALGEVRTILGADPGSGPRDLLIEHLHKLQQTSFMLPGDLRTATQVDQCAANSMVIRDAFAARATKAVEQIAEEMWDPEGLFKDLALALDRSIISVFPEMLKLDRGKPLADGLSGYDMAGFLESCLDNMEEMLRQALKDVEDKMLLELEAELRSDPSAL